MARVAVVDGNNVAYAEESSKQQPKVSNILAVREALQARGYRVIVIVDASLRHEIDDPQQLEALFDDRTVRQAPAGTDADYFVLETAEAEGAIVVSNDRYSDYQERYPWVDERKVPFMIIRGNVAFYEEAMP